MNDKVEKLVEWVAKQIGSTLYKSDNWQEYPEKSKILFLMSAKQILGHKDKDGNYDLALIDRERVFADYRMGRTLKVMGCEPVIPLAEAL